jgi:hypothetical protein
MTEAPPPSTAHHGLSKSRVMKGLQCTKALWLSVHRKHLATPVSPDQQAIFDQGTRVGELARERFAGGVLIDAPYWDPEQALAQTRAAIDDGALVLYEAAFVHEGVLVRVDVLRREYAAAPWQLLEVKASTSYKPDVHLPDVAVQLWVARGAGEVVDRCALMHIDRGCVHPQLERLFALEDVTAEAEAIQGEQAATVARLQAVVAIEDAPDVDLGPHCTKPYDCDFRAYCQAERGVPEPSVFDVRSMATAERWRWYRRGMADIDSLYAELQAGRLDGSAAVARSVEALATGRVFIDRDALRAGMASWQQPLLALDFETEGGAVPRHEGTRPYEQVPFQFSAHVRRAQGGARERGGEAGPGVNPETSGEVEGPRAEGPHREALAHHEYLHTDASDPRPAVSAALAELAHAVFGPELDGPGSVVAYNAGFESRCLALLADACPEHARPLLELERRLVDPLPILRDAVYHPGFGSSYSLKFVAPALLGDEAGYGELDVGSGTMAQVAFAELIADGCAAERREELARALREYCGQDTLVLLRVVEWMEGACNNRTKPSE